MVLFCSILALLFPPFSTSHAIIIESNVARYSSQTVTFSLSARSGSKIDHIVLIHGVNSNTCLGNVRARREMEFTAGQTVEAEWVWEFERSGNVPPGAVIWWQWELRDESGGVMVSDLHTITIEDENLRWQKIETANLSLYWSRGDENFGRKMLRIAEESFIRLAREAGLETTAAVRVMIYPSSDEMKSYLAHTVDWMGGVAFPEYGVVMIGISPDQDSWAEQSIPHELSHLIIGQRIYNCSTTDLPTWLSEGLADYATGPTPEQERAGVLNALKAGNLPALTGLANGFAADGALASRAYDQSHMVVEFMVETYGAEAISRLLDLIRSGEQIDTALRKVYGLDTLGLDQTWRASFGAGTAPTPARSVPTASRKPSAIPTLALFSPLSSPTVTPAAPTQTPVPTQLAAVTPTPHPSMTPVPPSPDGQAAGSSFPLMGLGIGAGIILVATVLYTRRRR